MHKDVSEPGIFSQSVSSIAKSGVRVDYTAEDTLKSFIIHPKPLVSSTNEAQQLQVVDVPNCAVDTDSPTVLDTESRKSPDGSTQSPNIECTKTQNKMQRDYGNVGAPAKLTSPKRVINKPAPFLRKRQGMAAWCSRLRGQGLPVRECASEALTAKPNRRHPVNSVRNSSTNDIEPPRRIIATRGRTQSALAGPSVPFQQSSFDHPTGGLFCGLVQKKRSISPAIDHLRDEANLPKDTKNGDTCKSINEEITVASSKPNTTRAEVRTDAGDLQEFELLEEIAENSSFSSLTTSFISKLGQTSLKERLNHNEMRLKEMALTENIYHAKPTPPTCMEMENLHHDISRNCNGVYPEAPERSILSVLDKHRTNPSTAFSQTARANAPMDGILTSNSQSKCKKVARFHLIRNATTCSRDDQSPENSSPEVDDLEQLHSKEPDVMRTYEEELRNSLDFDDAHSWNDVNMRELNAPTGMGKTTSKESTRESNMGFSDDEDDASLLLQNAPPMPSSGLDLTKPKDNGTHTHIIQRRPLCRPLSANSHFGSPVPPKLNNSTYESELIHLADEFVENIRRDSSSCGRSHGDSQVVLRQWISRLESEVRKFKQENSNLMKMKSEREDSMRRLDAETKRFDEIRAKETKAFNEFKEGELRKLKKERRVVEEYQRALKTMPSKKDREELERLREELLEARSELSRREMRWHAAISRLRSRIEELETERDEQKGRIDRLEGDRISLQGQLVKAQTIPENCKSNEFRRTVSAISSNRQTLNSISQSITLRGTKKLSEKTTSPSRERDRRIQLQHNQPPPLQPPTQQKQLIASCRLSSRSASRSGGLDTLADNRARSSSYGHNAPEKPPTSGRTEDSRNTSPASAQLMLPHKAASADGTRDSLVSGGYFTGDDDCQSIASGAQVNSLDGQPHRGDSVVNIPVKSGGAISVGFERSNPPASYPIRSVPSVMSALSVVDEVYPVPGTAASGLVVRTVKHPDGSVEQTFANNAIVVTYTNGSIKEVFPDGKTTIVSLFNGDIKRTLSDGRVVYQYAADGTVQITHMNGTEEINYADGRQEIIRGKSEADQSANGKQDGDMLEPSFPSPGSDMVSRRLPNGDREIRLPNGQKEIHSITGIKCRIYPDGTTKTVFPDGRHETRYASGRLRVKDAQGNLIIDTRLPVSACASLPPPLTTSTAASHTPNSLG